MSGLYIDTGSKILDVIVSGAFALLLCLVLMWLVRKITKKCFDRFTLINEMAKGFIMSAISIIMWILTAIIVADAIGIQTTSLVALFSVAGLALSLSVQNIMTNIFSGITLIFTHPFNVGDYIETGDRKGTVKSMGLFYTVITTLDNITISIPNSEISQSAVINYSGQPLRRLEILFEASYNDPTEKVKAALLEAANADSRVYSEPEPFAALNAFHGSNIEYVLRVWCKREDCPALSYALRESVRDSFDRNGIEISYDRVVVSGRQELDSMRNEE